jgi:Na+-translocating ferredoxin:NAD+ oxidoreductase RnfG subunit
MSKYLKCGVSLVLIFMLASFGLPKNINKKVSKEISSVFEITNFSTEMIVVSDKTNASLPTKINKDNLFKIISNNELVGYFYVGKAPSKTDQFDYLVMFDQSLNVVKAKVLIYREDYGNEIGSKRWLKQFIGKTSSDSLKYGQDIDAISGATISANSMTYAMSSLLKTIAILKAQDTF